jgi:hypothetical protein
LTESCCETDARGGCGGFVLRGVARHDEAVSRRQRLHFCDDYFGRFCVKRYPTTFTYLLDNNTFADANGGPSLVPLGGTLNNGYTFGVQQGLSLSGTGAFDTYSIDVHFRFDNINATLTVMKESSTSRIVP